MKTFSKTEEKLSGNRVFDVFDNAARFHLFDLRVALRHRRCRYGGLHNGSHRSTTESFESNGQEAEILRTKSD